MLTFRTPRFIQRLLAARKIARDIAQTEDDIRFAYTHLPDDPFRASRITNLSRRLTDQRCALANLRRPPMPALGQVHLPRNLQQVRGL